MIRVIKQFDIGKYTLIELDSPIPERKFEKVIINDEEYALEIAYDLENHIGILGTGDFAGKEIIFK